MKTLTRDEMKKVMGGVEEDKPKGKCCKDGDCSTCMTGLTCTNGATFVAC